MSVKDTVRDVVKTLSEGGYECQCLSCGHVETSERHCSDIRCSKCDGEMRRKDRPGLGR